jgi:hypothetical protein
LSILEDFAVNTDWTIDALVEKLKDADEFVRVHAATLLGSRGDEAVTAVPALIDLLENGDVLDRRLAALTLGEIGPAAEDALPALLDATDDEDDGVATMALEALDQIDLDEIEDEAA